ncbi:MAG: amino acid permease [Desulfotomaculum sp. BICA1-6]|nr:MAG: amino acid permease [Peptococcaceae bacterium BRH_c8a]KJS73478.1 MAG: amino acid permease [Desulfotomaculum sp. BICA1-6]
MKQNDGLSAWQLTMLALGTVVGGSFFLGSSIAIRAAGPAILLSFILGGILVYIILTALSEMTVADPKPGSFRTYSEQLFGPWLGFMVGWVYWTGLILAMSSEATAASIFLRAWIPQVPLPILAISIVVTVTLLNLLGAKLLSNLEGGLATIKLGALIGFIGLAAALILGLIPQKAPVGVGALALEPLFPAGIAGVAGSMLIVLFSYAGFEIIGLAASEARTPHKTIPRAITYTVIALVGLYCAVIATLLPLTPTGTLTEEVSPMVAALSAGGLGWAAGSINVILVSAIISTMLAATFGLGRMVRSLAHAGHAPSILIDRGDIPLRGILFSGAAMLFSVSLGYLLPAQIYIFLVSSGGFSLLFAYVIILATHYRYRKLYGCPPRGHCQLVGFPYTSMLAIAGLVIAILAMPFIPGQGSGLYVGLILTAFYLSLFYIFKVLPGKTLKRISVYAKPLPDNIPNKKDKTNKD